MNYHIVTREPQDKEQMDLFDILEEQERIAAQKVSNEDDKDNMKPP